MRCRKRIYRKGSWVELTFRRPTNEETNEFLEARYTVQKVGEVDDNSFHARVNFFDKIITGVKNLEDEEGPVTAERKDAIPGNWKIAFIVKEFENNEINIKN